MNPFAAPPRLAKLTIEITTLCNLKCAGCPRTTAMAQGAWADLHIPLDRFQRILDHIPPTEFVTLHGIGEPTLHPQFAELVAMARASGRRATGACSATLAIMRPRPSRTGTAMPITPACNSSLLKPTPVCAMLSICASSSAMSVTVFAAKRLRFIDSSSLRRRALGIWLRKSLPLEVQCRGTREPGLSSALSDQSVSTRSM